MILDKEEAAKKSCPMTFNRDEKPILKCRGDGCMAWIEEVCGQDTEAGSTKTGEGYCGLADHSRTY